MMPSPMQIFIILIVVLVVFGAGKLPKVMGDFGKGIKNLKDGLKEEEKASFTGESQDKPQSKDKK